MKQSEALFSRVAGASSVMRSGLWRSMVMSISLIASLLCTTSVAHSGNLDHPMTFESAGNGGNCNGCGSTAAQGEIVEGTPAAFEAFLKDHHPQGYIVFHSPGGNLGAALKLGAAMRRLNLTTVIGETVLDGTNNWTKKQVKGVCVSACAYAFLGGKTRYASEGYGVHQFFSTQTLAAEIEAKKDPIKDGSSDQSIVGLLTIYVKSMGVDTDLVFAASSTAPAAVYWLSIAELKRLRVDNSVDVQEPWKTEPYRDGAVAVTSVRSGGDEPLNLTIFCRKGVPVESPFLLLSKLIFNGASGWTPDSMTPDALKKSFTSWGLHFDERKFGENRPTTDIMNVSISKDGRAYVVIRLSATEVTDFTRSKIAQVQIDQARVYGYPFYGAFSLAGAGPNIDLVMRNCLGAN